MRSFQLPTWGIENSKLSYSEKREDDAAIAAAAKSIAQLDKNTRDDKDDHFSLWK